MRIIRLTSGGGGDHKRSRPAPVRPGWALSPAALRRIIELRRAVQLGTYNLDAGLQVVVRRLLQELRRLLQPRRQGA